MNINVQWSNGSSQLFTAIKGQKELFKLSVPRECSKVTIKTRIPVTDVQSFWYNSCDGGPSPRLAWKTQFMSGIQRNVPFITFFNRAGLLRGSFGLTNLIDDCDFRAEQNQELCTYDITMEMAISPETPDFAIFADLRQDIQWQQSLDSWRKAQNIPLPDFPAAAWDPVFCTWYAVHAAVTAPWVEKMVPLMLECGFTTLIVDDGWCYEDMKRVSPETLPVWYEKVGDWEICAEKFPDFPGHVKKMQALGAKYMVWVAPHFFGAKTRAYAEHADKSTGVIHEGTAYLDVANRDMAKVISDKLVKLAADNGLDGLKIDFLDVVHNNVEKPNGRDTLFLIDKLTSALRKNDPETLIEFRQSYATLATLPYATQFRAGDVPFDWMLNFGRLVTIRLCMGDDIPIHADPAYWDQNETPENIARHMISTLIGVPMLSMDLEKLLPREKEIISYWMSFYNSHRDILNHGHWEFLFGHRDIDAAIVEKDDRRIVFLTDAGRLPEVIAKEKKCIILNLSARELQVPGAECFNCCGKSGATGMIPLGGWGRL